VFALALGINRRQGGASGSVSQRPALILRSHIGGVLLYPLIEFCDLINERSTPSVEAR
jgi:hypothetical protein